MTDRLFLGQVHLHHITNVQHVFSFLQFRQTNTKHHQEERNNQISIATHNIVRTCRETQETIESLMATPAQHMHVLIGEHKRRLFTHQFVAEVHRVLVPGGMFFVATDHADYWQWIQEILHDQTLLKRTDHLPEIPEGLSGLTSFQIKYLKEGRSIFRVGYVKEL